MNSIEVYLNEAFESDLDKDYKFSEIINEKNSNKQIPEDLNSIRLDIAPEIENKKENVSVNKEDQDNVQNSSANKLGNLIIQLRSRVLIIWKKVIKFF